jgi:hypothetical protein
MKSDITVESVEPAYSGNELLLRFFRSEWFTPAVDIPFESSPNANDRYVYPI